MNVWSPGRVNLIGEHTDYSGGLALPIAIQLGVTLGIESRSREIRLQSETFGAAASVKPDGSGSPARGWARFAQAVARELTELGRPPVGLRASISSTLPAGAGLSSSAALEVAIALALCAVADFEIEPLTLASACRRAEERAVGVPCGILDQAACVLGAQDAAVFLDCASLEHTLTPVPREAAFLIIDSGIRRELASTAYADRRRELEEALARVGVTSPRELRVDELDLSGTPLRRLRHVVTENERVGQFAEALGMSDLERAGEVISASHASLRDDYEVSLAELDDLAAIAEESGALGARLIGGGFGGSILALVEAERTNEVMRAIARRNVTAQPPIAVRASDGARVRASAEVR